MFVVSKKIDCRNLYDPLPLLALRKALVLLRPGQIIELLSNDPGAPSDFRAWCEMTGHELLEVCDNVDHYGILIRCCKHVKE